MINLSQNDIELNRIIMSEVGLDFNGNALMDQDLFAPVTDGYKVYVGESRDRNQISFCPSMNKKQMEFFFKLYFFKMNALGEHNYYLSTYFIQDTNNVTGHGYIEAIFSDGHRIRSSEYINPILRFLDIIIKVNTGSSVDLSGYDKSKQQLKDERCKY